MSDPLTIAASNPTYPVVLPAYSMPPVAGLSNRSPLGIMNLVGAIIQPPGQASGDADLLTAQMDFRKAQELYDANAEVVAASAAMFGNMINMLDTQTLAPPEVDSDNVL